MDWTEYEAEGGDYVPVERWGQDHWSTFAYLETLAVDAKGMIDNRRMRCNPRLHRAFIGYIGTNGVRVMPPDFGGREYPTRLKDGELSGHDDWSCLEDMVAAGLLRAWFDRPAGDPIFGRAKITLTDRGKALAGQLRAHKAGGGCFANFAPIFQSA